MMLQALPIRNDVILKLIEEEKKKQQGEHEYKKQHQPEVVKIEGKRCYFDGSSKTEILENIRF